jgi:hypothetical protein
MKGRLSARHLPNLSTLQATISPRLLQGHSYPTFDDILSSHLCLFSYCHCYTRRSDTPCFILNHVYIAICRISFVPAQFGFLFFSSGREFKLSLGWFIILSGLGKPHIGLRFRKQPLHSSPIAFAGVNLSGQRPSWLVHWNISSHSGILRLEGTPTWVSCPFSIRIRFRSISWGQKAPYLVALLQLSTTA